MMTIIMYIILFIFGILSGCLLSFLIFKNKQKKTELVGELKIVNENNNESPYIFLQIIRPDILLGSLKKYVLLKVNRISPESDDVVKSKKISQK